MEEMSAELAPSSSALRVATPLYARRKHRDTPRYFNRRRRSLRVVHVTTMT